jgi:lactate dehydrogenase-like 2-hydroxyacid dehydrogenase
MQQLTNLKLIATRSTGFDHIPLDLRLTQKIMPILEIMLIM